MNKKHRNKQPEKKKNKKVIFVVSGLALAGILVIWIVYSLFSYWRNTLYIPEIPDLSGQPKVCETYINTMHSVALESPESSGSVGRLGMAYHANLFYDQAELCYIRAMNLNPGEWSWPYYLALIKEELGDVPSAMANLQKVIQTNPQVDQAWYRLGNAFLKQNASAEALNAFNKVLAMKPFIFQSTSTIKLSNKGTFPLKTFASFNIARVQFKQGKTGEARQTLTALIQSNPGFGPAYRLLSQVCSLLGEQDKADYYLLRAGDFISFLPPADIIYDDLIFYSRKTDFIIKQIDLAIRSHNNDWAATLNHHIMEYKLEDEEVVTKLLKLSVDLDQREGVETYGEIFSKMFQFDENALLDMTRFLISRKQYKLALFIIKRIKSINPASIPADLEYISVLRNQGQYQVAADYCKTILVAHPDNPHLKIELARILIYQGYFNEAAQQLSLSEKIDPENLAITLLRAKLGRAQNNATESIRLYREYLQANPADVAYTLELGNYYIELRQWITALRHFEDALKISPNHIDYLERYAWIMAACPDPHIRDGKKAMEFAERISVMQKYTEDQEFRSALTVAVTFAELKDFDKALKIVDDNLDKQKIKNNRTYIEKFDELQKLFRARKPYRL